jgi:hypothetical protein
MLRAVLKLKVLEWPDNSPDINPIENISSSMFFGVLQQPPDDNEEKGCLILIKVPPLACKQGEGHQNVNIQHNK